MVKIRTKGMNDTWDGGSIKRGFRERENENVIELIIQPLIDLE